MFIFPLYRIEIHSRNACFGKKFVYQFLYFFGAEILFIKIVHATSSTGLHYRILCATIMTTQLVFEFMIR